MINEEQIISKVLSKAKNKLITEDELFDIFSDFSLDIMQYPELCEKVFKSGVSIISQSNQSVEKYTATDVESGLKKTISRDLEITQKNSSDSEAIVSEENDCHYNNSHKLFLLNFNEKKSYLNTVPSSFSYKKRQEIFVNHWNELYVNILVVLCQRYASKLASWAGVSDIFKRNQIKENMHVIPIGNDLFVDISSESEDIIIGNIKRYIHVCNEKLENFLIYYRNLEIPVNSDVEQVKYSNSVKAEQSYFKCENEKSQESLCKEVKDVKCENEDISKLIEKSFNNILEYCKETMVRIKNEAHSAINLDNYEQSKISFENVYKKHFQINEVMNQLNKIKEQMLTSELITIKETKAELSENNNDESSDKNTGESYGRLEDWGGPWYSFNPQLMLNKKITKFKLKYNVYKVNDFSDAYIKIIEALFFNYSSKVEKLLRSSISRGLLKPYFTDIPYEKYRRIRNTNYYMLIDISDSEKVNKLTEVLTFFEVLSSNNFKISYL